MSAKQDERGIVYGLFINTAHLSHRTAMRVGPCFVAQKLRGVFMSSLPIDRPAAQAPAEPQFVVGQTVEGQWLAVERGNRSGGLFKTLQDAVHFVAFETSHRAGAMTMATAPLRLTF